MLASSLPPNSWQGMQITASENHPDWNARSRSRSGSDLGGNFYSQRRYVLGKHPNVSLYGRKYVAPGVYNWASYTGPMTPLPPQNMPFPPYMSASSDAVLDAWGAKAIALSKPTNAVADASVFLGELLLGGIPFLTGTALKRWFEGTKRARKVPADEYLNIEFGWKPIFRDASKFIDAVARADAVLAQYERDAGKTVRRRWSFPSESETSLITERTEMSPFINGGASALYTGAFPSGKVIGVRTTERRRWFSGAFTYYLPRGYSSRDELQRRALQAKKLLGLSLTPETLWNLAPWSWAIDWFTNAGDVVSNLSDMSTDGLILRYGYIMEHTVTTDTYTFSGPTGLQSGGRPAAFTLVSETKTRRKANPFGFGLTWGGLSPRQLAILAALGLSKS